MRILASSGGQLLADHGQNLLGGLHAAGFGRTIKRFNLDDDGALGEALPVSGDGEDVVNVDDAEGDGFHEALVDLLVRWRRQVEDPAAEGAGWVDEARPSHDQHDPRRLDLEQPVQNAMGGKGEVLNEEAFRVGETCDGRCERHGQVEI